MRHNSQELFEELILNITGELMFRKDALDPFRDLLEPKSLKIPSQPHAYIVLDQSLVPGHLFQRGNPFQVFDDILRHSQRNHHLLSFSLHSVVSPALRPFVYDLSIHQGDRDVNEACEVGMGSGIKAIG